MFCGSCGATLTDRSAFCSACGNRVETVGRMPTTGRTEKQSIRHPVFLFVALIVIVVIAIRSSQHDENSTAGNYAPSSTDNIRQSDVTVPAQQRSFTSLVESFVPSYNSADTEIRKTNVRFERKDALTQYFSRSGGLQFKGWVGEVHNLTTESDGKASLSVALKGSETVIKTWNNSFSDSPSHTMISRGDALYPSLTDIKDGDVVTVSGTFILEGGGQDYLRESSLTEDGSMTSPEFIVRFSEISRR